jgi:diaminopimelate epimerase
MIIFYKYQGTGNDFIIIDNRNKNITLTTTQIAQLCHRKMGIGADGLMLLQQKEGYDFEMKYYNADGNESSMCGNGGRCLTQFANDIGIKKEDYHFWAIDGEHESYFKEDWVYLKMIDVNTIEIVGEDKILNTGSPHYIKKVNNIKEVNVFEEGKAIRYSPSFNKEGINVNFVENLGANKIFVRTYERGVENETLSCGTGVTAAAITSVHSLGQHSIAVETLGGNLQVNFSLKLENEATNVWLCGPATFIFKGEWIS